MEGSTHLLHECKGILSSGSMDSNSVHGQLLHLRETAQ